jgi:opacity protein-like surface antigen
VRTDIEERDGIAPLMDLVRQEQELAIHLELAHTDSAEAPGLRFAEEWVLHDLPDLPIEVRLSTRAAIGPVVAGRPSGRYTSRVPSSGGGPTSRAGAVIRRVVVGLAIVLALRTTAADAFDAERVFQRDALLLSIEGGAGAQHNFQDSDQQTGLDLWYAGLRLGWLPFGTTGPGIVRGALEVGLEALYQQYHHPVDDFWAELSAVRRYHFTSLGRVVPYLEGGASAGATNLNVREIDSDFAFLLFAGAGASVFLTERVALYAGYRLVHVSNANLDRPNTGLEAHTGVAGITFFLGPRR